MKILILASNPRKDLDLDDEIRLLESVINQSRYRDRFEVVNALGVRVGDLQRLLLHHKPEIVHFCGHGAGEEGLIFKMDEGSEQWVQAEALANLFGLNPIRSHVQCVLLNACYSKKQADAIVNQIAYVVGMSHQIQDNAAIAFSKGFYLGLGEGCSIDDAFEFGCNASQLEISGSSKKMRSAATEEGVRKAEVIDAIQQTAILEHQKPVLRRNPDLMQAANPVVFGSEQPLSQAKREEIQMGVAQALIEEDTKVKQYRVRESLADPKLTPTPVNPVEPDQDDLSSERFRANYYARLRDLLAAQSWKDADQETSNRMCEVMNRQKEGWLRKEDIEKFPCLDLRNINRLWVKHSQGKFGFSVQKKIWQSCGSPMDYNKQWERFGETVGWKDTNGWPGWKAWYAYDDYKWGKEKAFVGHLPCLRGWLSFYGQDVREEDEEISLKLLGLENLMSKNIGIIGGVWNMFELFRMHSSPFPFFSLAHRLVNCNI